jgi:type II secretory pathway pseudopilin PulG
MRFFSLALAAHGFVLVDALISLAILGTTAAVVMGSIAMIDTWHRQIILKNRAINCASNLLEELRAGKIPQDRQLIVHDINLTWRIRPLKVPVHDHSCPSGDITIALQQIEVAAAWSDHDQSRCLKLVGVMP